ncbi:MAG TPA: uroporphyrinogen-III C-methyltransferase [Candidatus Binatus sp.]|nr:uroporphyrinogen-III C-methyltransferase [Candidatus Binatus sp.]
MIGRVYLVGAGPGDPGLLTRRGERCLAAADVIVHDYLVGRRLLELVRPEAEVIALGGGHEGAGRLAQADIEALLVARARAGKTVVRLKNGDPFLFGRGAEEAEALGRAGIPFEIVPGVSSALAVPAYAGIPLTHRDHASLVTIVTGHQARCGTGTAPPDLPWEALARQGGTLVFLMGMRQLPGIMSALVAHGLPGGTPAAVVQSGTSGRQATVVATAATLAARAVDAGLGPPGVVVVGSVVTARERVRWFEERPLFGRRIVVTRPRAQAGALADVLEQQGAEVIPFPTIAIVPPPDPAPLERAVAAAGGYDWIVFTSANGVQAFFERFAAQERDVRELAPVKLAAIGPETAAQLGRRLLRAAVVAGEYRAEGLLAALGAEDVRGRRILLPRAAGARAILPEELRRRGAEVDEVIAYRAVPPPGADVAALASALEAGGVDALTFTSSSTVRNFVEILGQPAVASIGRDGGPAVACIGPVTAETARELGLRVDVMPSAYTIPALAAALGDHFAGARTPERGARQRSRRK